MPDSPYIFISYSSKEMLAAEQVRDVLSKNGFSCWMAPASIEGGSDYTKAIPTAITNCSAVVFVCSENAQKSYWVKSEIIDAISKGKPVIPFIIDKSEMNSEFNFMLSPSHRILAYKDKAKAYESLIISLNGIVNSAQTSNKDSYVSKPIKNNSAVNSNNPVPNAVRVTANKPVRYSLSTVIIWLLYIIGELAIIIFLQTSQKTRVGEVAAISIVLITGLLPFTLICTHIIRRHKTAPVNIIKKRRLALTMIFAAYWAVVVALNLLAYTGVLSGVLSNDSGFGVIIAVIFIGTFAVLIIEITFTVSFRRTQYTIIN